MSIPWKASIYGRRLAAARREWAAVAAAIARFEPVVMVVPPGSTGATRELVGRGDVRLLELTYDDGWLRDNGPIIVERGAEPLALDWRFNGWGGAFDRFGQTWHDDDALPGALCRALELPRRAVDMVLEGGSVLSDGAGTIFTTQECLLDASRNPGMSRREIDAALRRWFGASTVVWLPFGLLGDLTGGHVDGVAMPIGPGRILAQVDPAGGEEGERLAANLDVLRAARDAGGRPYEIVEVPSLPRARVAGGPVVSHVYLNLAFARDAVIVPLAGVEEDRVALGLLREVFVDREVVGVRTPTMTWAGGGVHCVTQPWPRPRARAAP
jgi:agmatine deiminase